jgi:hypothetical protein
MESTAQVGQLLGLADAVAGVSEPDLVVQAALPMLLDIAAAQAALVVSAAEPSEEAGPRRVVAHAGIALAADDVAEVPADSRLVHCPVPAAWRGQGIGHVEAQQLPGHLGILMLGWQEEDLVVPQAVALAVAHLDAALAVAVSQENLADLAARVDNAQVLANMGTTTGTSRPTPTPGPTSSSGSTGTSRSRSTLPTIASSR